MQRPTLTNFVKTRKTHVLIVFVLLVAAAGGSFLYLHKPGIGKTQFDKDKNIAFSIDGKNYYKKDVQKMIAFPLSRNVAKNQAAREAFNDLKDIKAAQDLGYKPSNSDLATQKKMIYTTLKLTAAQESRYSDWFTLVATQSAINVFVNSATPPGYAGYSYVFFFGQHLQSSPDYKPAGLNDPKLVAKDQAYAKQKAYYYQQQLKDNKITPANALTKAGADMQALGHGTGNPNFNASFSVGQSLNSTVYFSDIVQYIVSHNKLGLSGVQIGRAPNAPLKSKGKNINMYYYFVDLTAAPTQKPINFKQFSQALGRVKTQYRGFAP